MFLAQKRISNYSLVDARILPFKQKQCKVVAIFAPKKKLIYNKLIWHFIHSLSTILHEILFKDLTYFLGTVNLSNISLLVSTVFIACMIPCQKLIGLNLILIGVDLGRSWEKTAALNLFTKPRSDKWRIYILIKLHCKVCLTTCLKNIKVLVGKHFFRYFKENVDTYLKEHQYRGGNCSIRMLI